MIPIIKNIRKGFTLMEIMMVIIVVGVVIGLALPNYSFTVEKTKLSEGLEILNALKTAQLSRFYERGSFANALSQIDVSIPVSQNFNAIADANLLLPVPFDDFTDNVAFVQRSTGTYRLNINANGVVTCTDLVGINCSKLGY